MNDHLPDTMTTMAIYLTWNSYGSWLPGDPRGWNRRGISGRLEPDADELSKARAILVDPIVTFSREQRAILRVSIDRTCETRGWEIHARVVQTQHAHLVVTASTPPERALNALKGEATRALRAQCPELVGRHIWARSGNLWALRSDAAVARAVRYVLDDHHGAHARAVDRSA